MVVRRTDIVMRPVMYVVQFKPQSHLNVYLNLAVTSHENTEQMTQRVCHYAEYWSVKLVADSGSDSLSVTVWKSWFRQLCVYGVLTGETHVFKHTPLLWFSHFKSKTKWIWYPAATVTPAPVVKSNNNKMFAKY